MNVPVITQDFKKIERTIEKKNKINELIHRHLICCFRLSKNNTIKSSPKTVTLPLLTNVFTYHDSTASSITTGTHTLDIIFKVLSLHLDHILFYKHRDFIRRNSGHLIMF